MSSYLGNRPATCQKYYIHPSVLEAYLDESLHDVVEKHSAIVIEDCHALQAEELAVVALLTEKTS